VQFVVCFFGDRKVTVVWGKTPLEIMLGLYADNHIIFLFTEMSKLFCSSLSLVFFMLLTSCSQPENKHLPQSVKVIRSQRHEIIIDCHYSFTEAIAGSKAPKSILKELELITVQYYSMDGKIHQGQLLTNKKMVSRLIAMFRFMKKIKFHVARVIPVVKYNWNDELSMEANNTYSFCYRNPSYSKHARGMAIDINPFLNPLRWKKGYTYHSVKPIGAVYDSTAVGAFSVLHPVVLEFKKNGMYWGHNFNKKFDDHHFEIKGTV
jgi:hypothetical protein